jgi:TBC1 domain family member 15
LKTVIDNIVNELSNTIELDSILVKAEALFKKFQRTVEAIDRKTSFPAPSSALSPSSETAALGGPPSPKPAVTNPRATPALLRSERQAASANSAPGPETPSSTARREGSALDKGKGPATSPRVITRVRPGDRVVRGKPEELKSPVTDAVSPELRNLLRRNAPWMDVKKLPGSGTGK